MTRRYRPFDPFERGGPFEGRGELRIPRPPRRFWVGASLFGLAFLIFFFSSPIVWFITERQWYDALGFQDVFTTKLSLQAALVIGSLVVAFAYLAGNVLIALRIKSGPALRAVGIKRPNIRSAAGVIGLLGAGLIALVLSGGAGTQWSTLALYQHASPTGITEPVLGQDISFYLLTLPFLHAVTGWALGLGFMSVLLIGALYGWRGDTFDLNLSPRAIAHVSVLLGIFAVCLAVWTWLARYDVMSAHSNAIVWGAAYTDVFARLPLYSFQAGAGLVLAGALIANAWLRRVAVPVIAAGIWVLLLLIGQIYPAIVQSFFVTPSAQS
ncbi:MAG: hypothetical protein PVS2B1_03690 [Candidatus Dormibacteraceae bacterium]